MSFLLGVGEIGVRNWCQTGLTRAIIPTLRAHHESYAFTNSEATVSILPLVWLT